MDTVDRVEISPILWAERVAWKGKKKRWGVKPIPVLFSRVRYRSNESVGDSTAEHTFQGGSYFEYSWPRSTPQGVEENPFADEWGFAPNSYYSTWKNYSSRGTRISYMVDQVGKASKEHWIWYKPVYHVSCMLIQSAKMPNLVDTNGNTVNFGSAGSTPPFIWKALVARTPQPPSWLIDDLSAKAEMRFREILTTQVDVLALIIETLEMFLVPGWGWEEFQKKFQKGLISSQRGYYRLLAEGHTKASALWLSWRWFIAPLIKDIKALVNLVDSAAKQLRWLKKVAGRPTDVQFRLRNVWNPGTYAVSFDMPFFQITADKESRHLSPPDPNRAVDGYIIEPYFRCTVEDWQLDFGATGQVLVNWDTSLPDDVALRKIKRALMGLTRPWNSVWEIAHLSWLFDYILTERAKLERMKQLYTILPKTLDPEDPDFDQGFNEIPLPTQLRQGHSWHWKTSWRVEFVNADNSVTDLGSCKLRIFSRHDGLPTALREGLASFLRLPDYWVNYVNLAAWQGGKIDVPVNWKLTDWEHLSSRFK